jgi:hypothetical protein
MDKIKGTMAALICSRKVMTVLFVSISTTSIFIVHSPQVKGRTK